MGRRTVWERIRAAFEQDRRFRAWFRGQLEHGPVMALERAGFAIVTAAAAMFVAEVLLDIGGYSLRWFVFTVLLGCAVTCVGAYFEWRAFKAFRVSFPPNIPVEA